MPAHNTFQTEPLPPPPVEETCPVTRKSYAWVVLALGAFFFGMLCQSPLVGLYGCDACRVLCGNSSV